MGPGFTFSAAHSFNSASSSATRSSLRAYVPARAPKPRNAKIARTLREILQQPDVAARLDGLGYEVIGSTPDGLRAFYQREYARSPSS